MAVKRRAEPTQPTLLMGGAGEPMDEAIRGALKRRGIRVHAAAGSALVRRVVEIAPDLVLLVGDAAQGAGTEALRQLAADPAASVVPVALLLNDNALHKKVHAFRSGAVAVIQRSASADAIAREIAQLVIEMPERSGETAGVLGESTLDDLMNLISKELRSGILSVEHDSTDPVRLVLGAGGQVDNALSDFVKKLRPLIASAEPARYEFHETTNVRFANLEDGESDSTLAVEQLKSLRMVLMDQKQERAKSLADVLRGHGALVAVSNVTVEGLQHARNLDPDVILLDSVALQGAGFEVVRTIRRDRRLRWCGLLITQWNEIWPDGDAAPALGPLASRILPLTQHDTTLGQRAKRLESFGTRLELTGPARFVRALAKAPELMHATVRSPHGSIELDVAEGLVVGSSGTHKGKALTGTEALAAILAWSTGRLEVEPRTHPDTADIMLPVDEAILAASEVMNRVAPASIRPPRPKARDAKPTPGLPIQVSEFLRSEAVRAGKAPEAAKSRTEATRSGTPVKPATSRDLAWGSMADLKAPKIPPQKKTKDPKARARTMLGMGITETKSSLPAVLTELPDVGFENDEVTRVGDSKKVSQYDGLSQDADDMSISDIMFLDDEEDSETHQIPIEEPDVAENTHAAFAATERAPAKVPVSVTLPTMPAGPPNFATEFDELKPQMTAHESTSADFASENTDLIQAPPYEAEIPEPKKRSVGWLGCGLVSMLVIGGLVALVILQPPQVVAKLPKELQALLPASQKQVNPDAAKTPEVKPETAVEANTPDATPETDAGVSDATTIDASAEETVEPPTTEVAAVDGFVLTNAEKRRPEQAADRLVREATKLMRKESYPEAKLALDRSLFLDAKNPSGLAGLATYYLRTEEPEKAVEWAQKALARRPKRAKYHVLLGDALRDSGKTEEAKLSWKKALSLDEDSNARSRLR